jgi:hypothetical protein
MIFGGEYRDRFEGYTGGSFKPNTTDAYVLSRLKLDLTIKPTAWFKVFMEGMDARSFDKTPSQPPYSRTPGISGRATASSAMSRNQSSDCGWAARKCLTAISV